jgi:cardiolipin synthase A/B
VSFALLADSDVTLYLVAMAARPSHAGFPGQHFAVAGHDLFVVHAPDERLAAVNAMIAAATQSIRMLFYMYADDETGREILDALIVAVKRGVRVQLIVDSFGSADLDYAFFEPLVQAGGEYHFFSTRKGFGYLIRNHQKMLIADARHALVGGFNITDQYFGRKGDDSWEDLGLIVSGAEVARLADYFDDIDRLSQDGKVRFLGIRGVIKNWRPGIGAIQWLLGGPTNRISPWALTLKRSLQVGKKFDIVAAYFAPSQTILRRVARVAKRGKGSRLVLAGKTDNKATIPAARLLYRYLMKRKASLYEYQTRPLHMKLMVIDDAVYIGSANLDVRSLFINLEIMLRIKDAALAAHMRGLVDLLVAQSEEQTVTLLKNRDRWWSRFKGGFAYFLVNTVDYTVGRRIKFRLLRNR